MVLKNIFYKTFSNFSNIFQFKRLLFSTTADKDNNFHKMDENLLSTTLNSMTVKQLKKLCKKCRLHKYSTLTKKNLIDLLSAHFLSQQAKMLEQAPFTLTEDDLPLILNKNNQINISVWYRIAKPQRPKCWLKSKTFNNLVDLHCRVTKKTRDEVIVTDADGNVYVDLLLALIIAAQFRVELKYKIYKFYVDQFKHQEATIKALRYELSLSQQGIFLETITRWETFSFSFAYYIIYINNIVKCGIVGGFNSKEKSDILLDLRLASHRDTYARFELINVFQFTDSQAVSGF